ncbi:eukaryotic translation initiation factor 4G-like protein [Medicago truncatula]|uniref:Eukaryotic translation initiation factor 4G-like protein n=1 Tax=Medicago truncatula TaxID=3880 RepID=A0A072TYB4_MEDTR|nr:eukaryotic translation initiation factor 4G-like protein [Medicago truncatula]
MSYNQSKSDKSDATYRRTTGRSASFNQHRGNTGGASYVKAGTGAAAPSLSSSRSFNKKPNNHAQGGPSRVNPTQANSAESNYASAVRATPNGSHVQPQFHGGSGASVTNATAKPSESSAAQRSTVVPKAPISQSPSVSSDSVAPTTPVKGDASKAFPFQFGSISPGTVNVMTIPARTSSAPPNIDEQKRDQARHDSSRPVLPVPIPPVPKQLPVNKGAGVTGQSKGGEAHTGTRAKQDTQVSSLPPASLMHKPSVIPHPGISMSMPYHQSQAPVHFGAANPQIQSHALPMPFPIGNAPQVQQQVFVHPMHPQGMMHQGQNIGYGPQIGHQLPHQFGNMGMGINPQYSPQQGGKFAVPRKTTPVKITHPDTHEELRLDKRADDGGSSGARSHSGMPSQSPSVQPFAASHAHITPNIQPPRINYAVSHGSQNVGFTNSSSHTSQPDNKTVTSIPGNVVPRNLEFSRDAPKAISPTLIGVSSVSIKPSGASDKVDSSFSNSNISGAQKGGSPSSSVISSGAHPLVPHKGPVICSEISSPQSNAASASTEKITSASLLPSSTAFSEHSVSVVSNNEGRNKESLSRSNSLKGNQKKLQKKGQLQHQVAVQSSTVANEPSLPVDGGISDCVVSEVVGNKTTYSAAIAKEDLLTTVASAFSATSESMSSVEEKTNGSTQISACASAEGPVTQAVDSLNNHKIDELDELSQEDKLLRQNELVGDKTEISTVQSDDTADFNPLKKGASELSTGVIPLRTGLQGQDEIESASCNTDCDRMADNLGISTSVLDSKNVSLSRNDSVVSNEDTSTNSGTSDHQSSGYLETTSKQCKDSSEDSGTGSESLPAASVTVDRPILEPSKVKGTSKGKKKRKEILQKADASGSTSDLYNAYKGPEENKEAVATSESAANVSTSENLKQLLMDAAQPATVANEQSRQSKAELEDWEDAADISTPKLEVSDKPQLDSNGSAITDKKYSRDFLLKFAEQCSDLPVGFEITADIAEALMSSNIGSHVLERTHSSTGRNTDRSGGVTRMDRRGSGVIKDDKWNKVSGAFRSDLRLDVIGGNTGFRPGQGGNSGVLGNPHTPTALPYGGAILSGPMQSMVNQSGVQRNSPDSERWQRAANFQQRGLIPSPSQSPLVTMHKAEKKYEVGKVTDEEQAKQRQLKGILNKLTPQNFEKLFEQVKAVNIDNAVTLTGVISQIFEKALMEPTFCEMYANFCFHLAVALPDLSQDNEKITFKRLLLNKCQEEFERGEREQEEANKADEGEVKQSDEEREEKRTKARRRMLGNIRLIGELYKKKMLTERIMHECIKKLLGQCQNPDEEDIEALCKLMSTIGEMIDHPKAKEHMDVYFERIKLLSNNMNLSSRLRFMLKDTIDLRKNRWQQRRKVEGPKKIEEVHRDASQERQSQAGRTGRGMGINAARRVPMDFGSRGSSMLSSPNAQMGGLPTQVRGYGSQDARGYERQSYEARTLSIPLPQRPLGDDSITLVPQGGLARGMSIRGPPAVSSFAGPNGYSTSSDRTSFNPREDLTSRYVPNRFSSPNQTSAHEHNMNYGNRDLRNADRLLDRPVVISPPARAQETTVSQNTSSEKGMSEEQLQNMSMAAIREYYSCLIFSHNDLTVSYVIQC